VVDPRLAIIEKRLSKIGKIIAVSSGKGGVGKSLIASTLALSLARKGHTVGLLDIDFTSPSTHVILGIEDAYPKEEKGIIPPIIHDLHYMSIVYYSGDSPSPLRGGEVSNALIELLAITRWGALDFLVIDMPPGLGDATLDIIRLVKSVHFLIITTSSKVAYETVKKLIQLLRSLEVHVVGVIENMKITSSQHIRDHIKELGLSFLGEIEFDNTLEDSIGNKDKLITSDFGNTVQKIVSRVSDFKF
jgi:ATP-binding protein involved in chromosome partitioning